MVPSEDDDRNKFLTSLIDILYKIISFGVINTISKKKVGKLLP